MKKQVMHSKSGSIEVMTYNNSSEVIQETFDLFLTRYQIVLKTSIEGCNFSF